MKKKYYYLVVTSFIVCIFQLSAIQTLAQFANCFNILFVSAIVLTYILPINESLLWSLCPAGIVDLYGHGPFGIYLISTLSLIFLVIFLQNNWLKQKSILSTSLVTAISLVIIQPIFISISYLSFKSHWLLINPMAHISLVSLMVGVVLESVSVSLLIKIFSKKIKFVLV